MRDINEMMNRGHLLENNFSIININGPQISFQLILIGSNHFDLDLISSKFTQITKIITQITH